MLSPYQLLAGHKTRQQKITSGPDANDPYIVSVTPHKNVVWTIHL